MVKGMVKVFPGYQKYMATEEDLVRENLLGTVNQLKKKDKMVARQWPAVFLVSSSYIMDIYFYQALCLPVLKAYGFE